jgi:hypothetical protein
MIDVLAWLETHELSVLIREGSSIFGFPTILFLHTLGLAMVAGVSIAIDLTVLRRSALVMPVQMLGLTRTMWLGFGINTVSGVALLLAYPAKALTNGVFYLKMSLVVAAVVIAPRVNRALHAADSPGVAANAAHEARRWAVASLILWAAAIVTGRLLAYTHSVLFASELQ